MTGGAASIGRAITEAFHASGVRVVRCSTVRCRGRGTRRRAWAPNVAFQRTDITNDADLDELVRRSVEAFGRLDFLVNNACSYVDSGQRSSRDDWLATLNTNLVSAAILAEEGAPRDRSGGGAIVNLSSISAYSVQSGRWTYRFPRPRCCF